MIKVDETDPVGEVKLSFPYRDIQIRRNVDPKDDYELDSEIGRGKFGTVYKCKEKSTGLPLAAKFIGCPKKEDRRNVEREIDIMKALQHPRLIQVYDAFENGKVMCVILELIEGGELFERVIDDDFILTEKSCTVFMRQICEGVEFIHKQKILHLDMKPENVLCLTKTGNRIKIIDFGLARRFDPDKKLQVLFGTPEFVAPEIVNFDAIGYGTDMWSVGVICYVLLSGLSPFMGHTDVETMANVTVAKYDFEEEAFAEITDTAKDFIEKLLVKDMTERMSASDCLKHQWLKRKKPPALQKVPSMDVTKDNLKHFVERWNEHPNSPYVFEVDSGLLRGNSLSDSSESLFGGSPSPCGSLGSSPGSPSGYSNGYHDLVTPPNVDFYRRASDSTVLTGNYDAEERFNLAEEIRKLSDKLYQLSNMPTNLTNEECPFEGTKTVENIQRTIPIQITNRKFGELPADHPNSPSCSIPWRRAKFKLNSSSRDVPMASRSIHKANCYGKSPKSPSGTKDLLLRLLDHWPGTKSASRPVARHGSISSSLMEDDSLGQKTISSLNSFFQSRAASKISFSHH
ncbi:unnamed protein product [Brassicogethes aeneus]|uniref:Protein kinase domain-containing protein n=1 Tax=Brassicogethes aeneus TaxID=1431903 RepID=A0A9P0BBR3_BRAAE|nr:unnamed protein product [Brassicogethes aeneus]